MSTPAVTVEQRGDLAEALLPEAAGLVVAVREETAEEIAGRLAGLSRHELEALAVVLAAMVDPERRLRDVLAWVDFDEYGAPLPWPNKSIRTVRSAGADPVDTDRTRGVDMAAVDAAVAGASRITLTGRERTAAVHLAAVRGMSTAEIAVRLGMTEEAVKRSWDRTKQRARLAGQPVPQRPAFAAA